MNIYECKSGDWSPRPMNDEEIAYLSAWNKIREFIKDNFRFDEEKQFDLPYNAYHKTALFVTADGIAYIGNGGHGYEYRKFVDKPNNSDTSFGTFNQPDGRLLQPNGKPQPNGKLSTSTYPMIKEVVDNWHELKAQIFAKKAHIESIKNFEA